MTSKSQIRGLGVFVISSKMWDHTAFNYETYLIYWTRSYHEYKFMVKNSYCIFIHKFRYEFVLQTYLMVTNSNYYTSMIFIYVLFTFFHTTYKIFSIFSCCVHSCTMNRRRHLEKCIIV